MSSKVMHGRLASPRFRAEYGGVVQLWLAPPLYFQNAGSRVPNLMTVAHAVRDFKQHVWCARYMKVAVERCHHAEL